MPTLCEFQKTDKLGRPFYVLKDCRTEESHFLICGLRSLTGKNTHKNFLGRFQNTDFCVEIANGTSASCTYGVLVYLKDRRLLKCSYVFPTDFYLAKISELSNFNNQPSPIFKLGLKKYLWHICCDEKYNDEPTNALVDASQAQFGEKVTVGDRHAIVISCNIINRRYFNGRLWTELLVAFTMQSSIRFESIDTIKREDVKVSTGRTRPVIRMSAVKERLGSFLDN